MRGTVAAALAQARAILLEALDPEGVCSALVEPESVRANGGIGCIGARSLRRVLAEGPGRLSGGGGSEQTIVNGLRARRW